VQEICNGLHAAINGVLERKARRYSYGVLHGVIDACNIGRRFTGWDCWVDDAGGVVVLLMQRCSIVTAMSSNNNVAEYI